ncbi:MAG: acetyltransferase [Holophagaceae bacterium]
MNIRAATLGDHPALLALWLRSVRATHTFLTEADIQALHPLVRDHALPALELWVLEDGGTILGWIGLDGAKLEALFMDPDHAGRGGGRQLVAHARALKGPLTLDVNEQNPGAVAFYRRLGFRVTGRSDLDGQGRPFPLLHMAEGGDA